MGGCGQEYFFGLVRMTQSDYIRLLIKTELLQLCFTALQFLYFNFFEPEVWEMHDNLIMKFEVCYIVMANLAPLLLMKSI